MTAGDSISAPERELVKRLAIVAAFVFVFTAAFSHLHRMYSEKFFDITGGAKWIWARHRMSDGTPLAFFAARNFDLPENRVHTRLRLLGDPEYTVWINGRELAGRRVGEERALDTYDISPFVQTGRNRIVIAVRAPQGVGGLIATIGIAPETPNWVVTDDTWTIYREWDPELPRRDVASLNRQSPLVIGEPPVGKWNYLAVADKTLVDRTETIVQPSDAFAYTGKLPRISTRGGVAVAVIEDAPAKAFDFGFTRGRVRVVSESPRITSQLVPLRFTFLREELAYPERNLRPIVFAPGESVVTTPEEHDFRYAMAFGKGVQRVELVR